MINATQLINAAISAAEATLKPGEVTNWIKALRLIAPQVTESLNATVFQSQDIAFVDKTSKPKTKKKKA